MSVTPSPISPQGHIIDPIPAKIREVSSQGQITKMELSDVKEKLEEEIQRLEEIKDPKSAIGQQIVTLKILARRIALYIQLARIFKLENSSSFPFKEDFIQFAEKAFQIEPDFAEPDFGDLHRTIGAGNQADVYEATYNNLNVAVKVPHETTPARKAFYHEIYTLLHFEHPNIIQLIDTMKHSETVKNGLILERADGSLSRLLNRGLDIEIERVAQEILSGLAHIHRNHFVHGDLNTSNILLKDGRVLIIDFGLAEKSGSNAKGKCYWRFRPPEFFGDFAQPPHIFPNVDIWSTGVILYDILAKNNVKDGPFTMDEAEGKRHAVALPQLEERLSKHQPTFNQKIFGLVMSCLKIDPNERPSANELLETLQV